mmetsp:Transcript_15038/g.28901  ORF Transcript_15038/g.28901 Transcript_15038/m.28901 type:complete len:135 (-) Transcript_15038:249-653(-)
MPSALPSRLKTATSVAAEEAAVVGNHDAVEATAVTMVLVEGTTMVNVGEAGDTTATSVTAGEGMTVKEGAAGVGGDEMTVTNAHHPAQVVGVAGSQQTAICFSSSEEVLGKPHAMACPYSLMQAFEPFHCTTRH